MKNPPTLADACIATALDKHFYGFKANAHNTVVRNMLREVAHARKFVLDAPMSRFLADLSDSFWRGGLRKRHHMLDNARQFARLPHALTWIECSYHADYIERIKEIKGQGVVTLGGNNPERVGWLLRQHPKNEAAFNCVEVRSSVRDPARVFMHPMASAWCADDSPSPWPRFLGIGEFRIDDEGGNVSEAVVEMPGYRSNQVHWHAFLGDLFTAQMLQDLYERLAHTGSHPSAIVKPVVSLRTIWALLATINDLPVKIELVEPSKGFVARGSYKKFLKHSIVHLTVPETRFRKVLFKVAALLRRRAHQVRAHWRKDWLHPLSPLCDHVWEAQGKHNVCTRCHGHKIFIAEHQRGDASLGFVTHDYDVHRE